MIHDISEVFKDYCKAYNQILTSFQPCLGTKQSINEANQVHQFLDAYKKKYPDAITWMELPIKDVREDGSFYTARIDGFIVVQKPARIIFIEAKRLSREKKVDSLREDVKRMKRILEQNYSGDRKIKNLNLDDYDVTALFLADVWCKKVELYNKWESYLESLKIEGMTILDKNKAEVSNGYMLMYVMMSYDNPKKK